MKKQIGLTIGAGLLSSFMVGSAIAGCGCCKREGYHPGFAEHEYTKSRDHRYHQYVYPVQPHRFYERYDMPYFYYPGEFSTGPGMGVYFRYR